MAASWAWRIKRGAAGLLAAALPEAERKRLAGHFEADPLRWSAVLGLLGISIGVFLYVFGAIRFIQTCGGDTAMALVGAGSDRVTNFDIGGGGVLCYLAWPFHPRAVLGLALIGIGIARMISVAIAHQPLAEPVVWLAVRGFTGLRARNAAQHRRLELGPERPDRLLEEAGADLVIVTCREKPGWNEAVTIEVQERFYRIRGVEERPDGPDGTMRAIAYRLERAADHDVVRGLIRYVPVAVRDAGHRV